MATGKILKIRWVAGRVSRTLSYTEGAPSSGLEGRVLGLDFLFREREIQSYPRYLPAIQRLTSILFFVLVLLDKVLPL